VTLEELLGSQLSSQLHRFGQHPASWSREERIEYIRTQTLGAVSELMEVLDETGWKPWKQDEYGAVDRGRYIDELSDVIIFITNLALAVGCTPDELSDAIRQTQDKNNRRIKEGY
jgi:hypothetical protein